MQLRIDVSILEIFEFVHIFHTNLNVFEMHSNNFDKFDSPRNLYHTFKIDLKQSSMSKIEIGK